MSNCDFYNPCIYLYNYYNSISHVKFILGFTLFLDFVHLLLFGTEHEVSEGESVSVLRQKDGKYPLMSVG